MIAGLYVDDERKIPDELQQLGWVRAASFHEAIVMLETYQFESLSLDHDIASFYGYTEMTGYHIAQWLAHRKQDGNFVPLNYNVHSMNPVGRNNIQGIIDRYLT